MCNQFVLVGILLEIKDNSIIINTTIDKIEVKVLSSMRKNIQNYSKIGEVVGVRGKITATNNQIELICEKCTFFSVPLSEKSAN